MSGEIDYEAIAPPAETSPENYHYTARRAEILQLIRKAGHPRAINQSRLAERYGTSQSNINNDITVLAEYVDQNLGNRRSITTETVYDRSIIELEEAGEWFKAAKVAKMRDDWIDDHKALEELQERMDAYEESQQRAKYR